MTATRTRAWALSLALLLGAAVAPAAADEAPAKQTVTGQLTVPPGEHQVKPHVANGYVGLMAEPEPIPYPPDFEQMSLAEKQAWMRQWQQTEEGRQWIMRQASRRFMSRTDEQGRFRFENVPPGEYLLQAVVGEVGVQSPRSEPAAELMDRVTVGAAAVELGELAMRVTRSARVGDEAPLFEVKTVEDKPLKLADYRGKYVLLDFWAVWCGPCLGETPHLKAAYEAFGARPDFAMIALSLDPSPDEPIAYAKQKDLHWVQGFLGDWNQDTVTKDYGVRGIPQIMLIGPDGKILAKDLRGAGIKEALARHLPTEPPAE